MVVSRVRGFTGRPDRVILMRGIKKYFFHEQYAYEKNTRQNSECMNKMWMLKTRNPSVHLFFYPIYYIERCYNYRKK